MCHHLEVITVRIYKAFGLSGRTHSSVPDATRSHCSQPLRKPPGVKPDGYQASGEMPNWGWFGPLVDVARNSPE